MTVLHCKVVEVWAILHSVPGHSSDKLVVNNTAVQ